MTITMGDIFTWSSCCRIWSCCLCYYVGCSWRICCVHCYKYKQNRVTQPVESRKKRLQQSVVLSSAFCWSQIRRGCLTTETMELLLWVALKFMTGDESNDRQTLVCASFLEIRCMSILISVTKCPITLRLNFNMQAIKGSITLSTYIHPHTHTRHTHTYI